MQKVLIVYYSHTGSNHYLATKLAHDLTADLAEIHPRGSSFFIQLILSQLKFSFGVNKLDFDVSSYDKIVLVGPVWTGQLIAPLRSFLKQYKDQIRELYFLTCCGSKDSEKDGRFGYNNIFSRIKEIVGPVCKHCAALPIALVIPADKQDDGDYIMNTRLTDDNFNETIASRYNDFVTALSH